MISKHQAIVLSTIKYGDSSVIAKFFCKEKGLLTVMCKGIRKSKNGKMGLFQPLALCEIIVSQKPNQNMAMLREIKNTPPLVYLYSQPSFSPVYLYLSSLITQVIYEDNADEELFDFIWDYILVLDSQKLSMINIPLHFTCHLLKIAGYLPYLDFKGENQQIQIAGDDQLNATLVQLCIEHNATVLCTTKIDSEARKNCLEYLVTSSAKTLQNNKLKDIYSHIKFLYE